MRVVFFLAILGVANALLAPVPRQHVRRMNSRIYSEKTPEEMLEEAARLRAEVQAEAPAPAPISVEDAKAKIYAALKRATQSRDKNELQIALSAAEGAGFSGSDPIVRKAVIAYNQVTELSDTMRKRLITEARSQGGDPSVNWNPGTAYLGIFVVVTLLVILGGKGILY